VAARRGRVASAARAAGRPRPRDLERAVACHDSEAATHCAWRGQRSSGAPRRWPRATPRRANGRALEGDRRADKSDRKRNEWIEISG
jgi:hypothetical protein